ncbi:MAG: response regulator [Clostridia bacterium]|nr:response regulator [Clostridia bacterium]
MIIFAIDDEAAMLSELHNAIGEASPGTAIHNFRFAADALNAITEKGIVPDVVFSDIELPGMDGLDLAIRIKRLAPGAKIVFVTGYSQYAVDAYRQHINGYVLKPIDARQIRQELDYLVHPDRQESSELRVRCFGSFEIYWEGKPIAFGRKQTKELLAFLIDRNSICTSEEISDALWEGDSDIKACKTRLRSLLHDLKKTFSEIGAENILIRRRDAIGVDTSRMDCDYYRFLKGDLQAINAFTGEYMKQYSWAEATLGRILFKQP